MAKTTSKKKMSYPRSFQSEKYPKFIQNSIFLKAYPKPEKVFPRIGLKNCKIRLSSLKLNNKDMYAQYLDDIMTAFMRMNPGSEIDNNDIADDYDFLGEMANLHCDEYERQYNDVDIISIIEAKGKVVYQMPKHWQFYHFKVGKDRDLMNIIEQMKTVMPKKEAEKFSAIKMSKTFDIGINNAKNLSICFSSDGDQGYWDLATMSMRGIPSCMNWKSESAKSLVGTILDPYAGIIYLTDDKATKHGNNIVARCVVRFVIDAHTNEPAMFLEQLYTHQGQANNEDIIKVFKLFIKQRTGLEVAYYNNDNDRGYHIPASETVEAILDANGYDIEPCYDQNDVSALSYRDSGITYKKFNKFYDPSKVRL